ncbi:hypothetical protein PENPOL_c007G02207 [Penicillium polonicum]|uniref:Acyclic terpene utilisation N-terminal domain-containing protein n=1 Tax=Penicillium polonicum TaxID=60169 RepID=A0A1V6NIT2_PENPO|nr:hypothetical protein PENPOL_c007G02207 [Penicillium polonicum]
MYRQATGAVDFITGDWRVSSQRQSTYLRIFIAVEAAVLAVGRAMKDISLKHFSGCHSSLDMRTAVPRPFLAYYSAIVKQDGLNEEINFVNGPDSIISFPTGHPSAYKALQSRASYNHSPSSDEVTLLQLGLFDWETLLLPDEGPNSEEASLESRGDRHDRHEPWGLYLALDSTCRLSNNSL